MITHSTLVVDIIIGASGSPKSVRESTRRKFVCSFFHIRLTEYVTSYSTLSVQTLILWQGGERVCTLPSVDGTVVW